MSCFPSLHLSPSHLLFLVNFWWSGTIQVSSQQLSSNCVFISLPCYSLKKQPSSVFLPSDLTHTVVYCQSGCQAARFSSRVPYNQQGIRSACKVFQRKILSSLVHLSTWSGSSQRYVLLTTSIRILGSYVKRTVSLQF